MHPNSPVNMLEVLLMVKVLYVASQINAIGNEIQRAIPKIFAYCRNLKSTIVEARNI